MTKFKPIGTHQGASGLVANLMYTIPIGSEAFIAKDDVKNIRQRAQYWGKKRGIKLGIVSVDGGFLVQARDKGEGK